MTPTSAEARASFRIRPLPAFTPFLVVAVVHLSALLAGNIVLDGATKPFLMPALLIGLLLALAALKPMPVRIAALAGAAIVFSWFGDVALASPGDAGFLLGLGGFFCAHVVYVVLFATSLRQRRMPRLAWLYAVWWAAFVALLAPHAGALLVPLAVYGAVLGAVASLAMACNRWIAVGGALFVVSDSLLGLHLFMPGFDFAQIDVTIMVAYLAAQGAIAFGVFLHCVVVQRRAVLSAS
ncbi:MAG: lysoplasmalogenase [Microbacteriaceae bacterium]